MSDYSPKRILCVEDDKDTCDLIKLILNQEGYIVLTAENMEKALSVIQNERISLCILDKKLPDGNGTDLCRKIKEFDETIAVVFYSGAARTSDIEEAKEAGADEYLIKPLGWDSLAETVNKLLEPNIQI
jgi:DNA-binding response OmpR family regulator